MTTPELILMAGSSGSFKVIFDIIKTLPSNFSVPILVVIHRGKEQNNNLENSLNHYSNILIKEISDKEEIKKGVVYLAPADYHVLIEEEKVFSLDISEPVKFSRPSIDISMESASEIFKDKLLAILFSGSNNDGSEGLLKIIQEGGHSLVQDPNEAETPTMPLSALKLNKKIKALSTREIETLIKSFF